MLTSELIAAAQESLRIYGDKPVEVTGSEGDGMAKGRAYSTEDTHETFRINSDLICSSDAL
jgi:hypothetical protein